MDPGASNMTCNFDRSPVTKAFSSNSPPRNYQTLMRGTYVLTMRILGHTSSFNIRVDWVCMPTSMFLLNCTLLL